MRYLYRVRALVSLVAENTQIIENDLFLIGFSDNQPEGLPTKEEILDGFQGLDKKYSRSEARKIFSIAAGANYIKIHANLLGEEKVEVTPKGHVFLTRTGYINALAESMGKVWPALTILISLIAVAISVWAILED